MRMLIAPDGRVAHHWPKVRAEGHAEQVRQRLAELRSAAVPTAAALRPQQAKAGSRAASTAKAGGRKPARATPKTAARRRAK